MPEKVTRVAAIKRYFSTKEKPVTLSEMKALTKDERDELGRAAAEAMGLEIEEVSRAA